MGYSSQSAVLKREIEAKLASRIPAALSPQAIQAPRLVSSGVSEIDGLLGGGLPIGGVTEFTGVANSGRTSLAFALLAEATTDSACAYIDVDDTMDPKSSAACGVNHRNLLWVRVASTTLKPRAASFSPAQITQDAPPSLGKMVGGHCGSNHPRTETKGLDAALGKMLTQKSEARLQKMEGTPGYPNRKLSLSAAPEEHVAFEHFNARHADDSDPIRQVLFHQRCMQDEKMALEILFEAVARFSPRVQIMASPINGYANGKQLAAVLLVDQSGTETLFGNGRSYAEAIKKALQELDFPANVAVAPNAEASLLLARSYTGVTRVDAKDVQAKLAPLPLSMLSSEAAPLATLKRWGIRNLGELAKLPETALISRIGQQGKRLQRLAMGREDHLLVPQDPSFVLSEHVELDGPLESLEPLLFILSPMLETILQQAINHAYALRSVTITLDLEKAAAHRLEVRPAIPAQSKDLLLKLLNLKLQSDPPQAGILGVTMDAEPAVPQVAQRGLFQAQFPEPDKLDLLIARLKSIVGEDNVGSPVLANSFCDDEFVMEPFQPSAGGKAPVTPIAPRSALRRFRPPQQAKVIYRDAVPSILFWRGERLELGSVSGPWQSSGYWWDGRRWEADEWDAVIAKSPQALRLRHETEPGTWYVAGQYD